MNEAVFLDRDGVINKLIYKEITGEFEPPHNPNELIIYEGVAQSLRKLNEAGFLLFLISNQPDAAKGKTTIENLHKVQEKLHEYLVSNNIFFKKYYYCFHHSDGIVSEYKSDCECRKPKPYFLLQAIDEFNIKPEISWMIGDRDSDIECGKSAGVRTILVENTDSESYRGETSPDFTVSDFNKAVSLILKFKEDDKIN